MAKQLYSYATLVLLTVFSLTLAIYTHVGTPVANAATNNTINFQARLLTNTGALVPDGNYHVEFKIYDSAAAGGTNQGVCSTDSSTDDCWWRETRTTGNLIAVKNGYLTANLGSVTAFGANIPWDQELWLSMRIGGNAGAASWEVTEMTPRMKITSVPFAQSAKTSQQLKVTSGANSTTLSVTVPTGTNTIALPDASGTVAVSASGNIALSAAGNITLTGQVPIANGGTNASTSQGAINNISQLTTEGDLLYFNGTNSTRLARGADGQCLTSNTTTIQWGSCGALGSGVDTVGAFSGSSQVNGATISGTTITFGPADGTNPGMVSTGAQTIAGAKTFTGGIVLSSSNISLGTNSIVTSTATISSTELDRLDGKDAALVDANDSLTSTFGTIDTGDTITGTTINGTTGINTGAGAGTQRIDASGNLVNIGNITGTGAVTLASTGGANALTLNSGSGTIILGANTLSRTAVGTTTVNLVDAANTTFAITNSGTGIANLTVDGGGSFGANLSITAGGISVTGNSTINGTLTSLTGLTSSGTITFSGLNTAGLVQTNGSGVLSTGAVDRNSATYFNTTLTAANGGTGLSTYAIGDLIYADTTSTLARRAVGTNNQCLISNGTTPVWGACPAGSGSIVQVPTTTAQNTITPTTASVVGLTVNGTSNATGATALIVNQSNATQNGANINLTNASGTQAAGLAINRSTAGGTTTSLLSLTQTNGTATNAISITGTFTNLINSTNFSVTNAGNADFAGTLTAGTANAFTVSAAGAIVGVGVNSGTGAIQGTGGLAVTGNSTIAGTLTSLTGLTSAGTITFSGLSTAGIVTNTAGGVLGTVASLPVANGGTGATSFTTNGILYGNNTGAVLVTAASTGDNQCLITPTSGSAPVWGSCLAGGGGTLFTDAGTFTYLTSVTDDFVIGGNSAATASLYVDESAGSTTLGNSTLAGALKISDGSNNEVTIDISGVSTNYTLRLPTSSGASGQCLKNSSTPGYLEYANCNNGSGAGGAITLDDAYEAGNQLTTSDARDILFTLANTATDSSFIVDIQGTGNVFDVRDNSSPVFTIADNGLLTATGSANFNGGATIRGLTVNNATSTDDQIATSITTGGAARFTGTITNADLTANQSYTLPNATGTFCLSSGNCTGTGGYGDILNNGQNGTVRIGTNDASVLYLEAGNTDRISISNINGDVNIIGGALLTAGTTRLTNAGILQNVTYQGNTITTTYGGTGITSANTGTLLVGNAGNWGALTIGTNNQCLISNGTTALWGSCTSGGGGFTSLTLAGNSGTSQTINDADTINVRGDGTVLTSVAGATDTVTLSVVADSIGNSQLAFDTGQNLTTTSNVQFANVTATGTLSVQGNTTIGNATTDRLTVTSQILGTNALVFQGATDNAFSTTFAISDPTVNRTVTFPDATGTVCLTSGNCAGIGGTGDILQGGNTFGANVIIGADDNFGIELQANGITRFSIDNLGAGLMNGALSVAGNFVVNTDKFTVDTTTGATTIGATNSTGTMTLGRSSTASNTINIGAAAGNTYTQTINIGTSATAGSTTNTTIGSTVAGTTNIQGNARLSALTTNGFLKTTGGNGTLAVSATVALGSEVSGTLGATNGGTGQATVTTGDLLYGSAANTWGKLAAVASGQCLLSQGVGVAPAWGACPGGGSLFTDSGTLTYLTSATDDLALGSTTQAGAKFFFDTSAAALYLGTDNSANGSLTLYSSGAGITDATISTNATGDLLLQAQSGAVIIGDGSGNIQFQLDNPADVFTASKSATISSPYSNTDYSFSRTLTNGVNTQANGGNILSVTDNSSLVAGTTSNYNLIYGNAAPTGGSAFSGNLLRLQSAGTDRFVVNSNGNVTTGTWQGTAVGAIYGGTGQTGYAVGDLLFANTTTSLSKLAAVASGSCLISNGINTAPSWGACGGGGSYVNFAPASAQTDTTTNSSIFINKTGASGNILQLQKNAVNKLIVTNAGNVGINATGANLLSVNNLTTADTVAQVAIATGATTNRGLVIQATAGQAEYLFGVQNSSGAEMALISNNGGITTNSVDGITVTGGLTYLQPGSNASNALWVRGKASQSADLALFQNSAGTTLAGIGATGNYYVGTTSGANKINVNALTTADSLAQLAISTGATTNKGLVIQGVAGQTGYLLEFQDSAGNGLVGVSSNGSINQAVGAGIWVGGNGLNNTSSGNNAEILLPTTGTRINRNVADANVALIVTQENAGSTGNILNLANSASTVMTVSQSGAALFKNSADSATAFQIQDTGSASLLTVNTVTRAAGTAGNMLKVGNSTGTDTATTFLVVDSSTADPTTNLASLNGGLFYNSTTNKLSVVENGTVKVLCNTTDLGCGTGGTGVLLAPASAQTDTSTNSSIFINKTGASGNILQLQKSGTDALLLTNSGNLVVTDGSTSPAGWGFEIIGKSFGMRGTTANGSPFVFSQNVQTSVDQQYGLQMQNAFSLDHASLPATVAVMRGVLSAPTITNATGKTVTDAIGLEVRNFRNDDANPATITNRIGLKVREAANGTSTITNNYGIFVENLNATANTTNDYPLYLAGASNPILSINGNGDAAFRNQSNGSTAFQIQDSAAASLFTANTVTRAAGTAGNMLKVGNSTGTDTATTFLVVDSSTANPTTNLASLNGGLFYNSTTNKLSVVENGTVKVLCNTTDLGCGTGGTGVLLAPASAQTDTSTNSSIFINKTGASGNILQLQKGGSNKLVVANTGYVGVNSSAPESDLMVGSDGDAVRIQHGNPVWGVSIDVATVGFWARGYSFYDSSTDTIPGEFGGYGGANALNYLYAGKTWNDAVAVFDTVNTRLGVVTTTPDEVLDVDTVGRNEDAFIRVMSTDNYRTGIKLREDHNNIGFTLQYLGGIGGVPGSNQFQLLAHENDAAGIAIMTAERANGAVIFRNSVNSTSAFQVQNALGSSIFNVDTSAKLVSIENSEGELRLRDTDSAATWSINAGGLGDFEIGSVGATFSAMTLQSSNGSAKFQNSTDSANAFLVKDTNGVDVLKVDTIKGETSTSSLVVGDSVVTKTFYYNFAHAVANQKIDLYFPANQGYSGSFDVSLLGNYNNGNAMGELTKKFNFGANGSGTAWLNKSHYTSVNAEISDDFAISDITWDATNSRWRIQIVHRNSNGNDIGIVVKGMDSGRSDSQYLSSMALGTVYTTDTTTFAVPTVTVPGNFGIGVSDATNKLTVNTLTTPDADVQVAISTGAAGNNGLIVQGVAGQTASLLKIEDSSGVTQSAFGATGALSTNLSIWGVGLVNVSTGNNASVAVNTTGTVISRNIADANTALIVRQQHASSTGDILQLQNSGSTVMSVSQSGAALFKNTSDSITAFQIQKSNGVALLLADTQNSRIDINNIVTGGGNNNALYVQVSSVSNAADQIGSDFSLNVSPSSASTRLYTSLSGFASSSSANLANGSLYGVAGGAGSYSSSTVGNLYGGMFNVFKGSTGSVTNASALAVRVNNENATGTLSNAYGLQVMNASNAGTITNNYGLYVDNMTTGTNRYPLYLVGASNPILSVNSNGDTTFRNQSNSSTAFQILDSTGSNILRVNSSSKGIQVGGSNLYWDSTTVTGAPQIIGINNTVLQNSTNSSQYGMQLQPVFDLSTVTGGTLGNLYSNATLADIGVAPSSSVTNAYGQVVRLNNTANANITNLYSIRIMNGSGTGVTNKYGLYVDAVSGGSSVNYPIYLKSSGSGELLSINSTGDTIHKTSTNSTTAFQIQNAAGTSLVVADTSSGNGRVGIGAAPGAFRLDVVDSQATTYVARIQNTNTTNTADGLLIDLGVANASRGTGNYFVGFAGAGTVAGKIQGGASAVAYTTTGADYAEYFKANPNDLPQAGELVMLDTTNSQSVTRSGSNTQTPLAGIVSTNPGFIGNGPLCNVDDNDCDANYAKYNSLVALNGQVPAKVNASNGPIARGDPIAVSGVEGEGAKALSSGYIVGYAMEELASGNGVIQVLVRPQYHTLNVAQELQGTGLNITGNATVSGDIVTGGNITAAGNLNINGVTILDSLTVNGGAIFNGNLTVQNITVANITINGKIITAGNAPVAAVGAAAGTQDVLNNIAAPKVTIEGNDTSGTITIVAGANTSADELAKVTFDKPFTNKPRVVFSPANRDSANVGAYYDVSTATNTEFSLFTDQAPQAGKTYVFTYFIVE